MGLEKSPQSAALISSGKPAGVFAAKKSGQMSIGLSFGGNLPTLQMRFLLHKFVSLRSLGTVLPC